MYAVQFAVVTDASNSHVPAALIVTLWVAVFNVTAPVLYSTVSKLILVVVFAVKAWSTPRFHWK